MNPPTDAPVIRAVGVDIFDSSVANCEGAVTVVLCRRNTELRDGSDHFTGVGEALVITVGAMYADAVGYRISASNQTTL